MIAMHDLDDQQIMVEEVEPCPEVFHRVCLYTIRVLLIDVFVAEESFRSNYCVSLFPLFDVFRTFEDVASNINVLKFCCEMMVFVVLDKLRDGDSFVPQSGDNQVTEPSEMFRPSRLWI